MIALVHELSAENYSKDAIYHAFQEAVLVVRGQGSQTESREEESLLDVMDLLTGFCDPDSALLTDDQLQRQAVLGSTSSLLDELLGPAPSVQEVLDELDRQYREQGTSERFDASLQTLRQRSPFQPFTVELLSGDRFEVDYPDALVV